MDVRWLTAVVAAGLVLPLAAPTASGAAVRTARTFPGANGKIVFSGFPNPSAADPLEEIYVVNADGSGLTRLTHNNGDRVSDVFPDWAPTGKKFVFARTPANGDTELYVMSASGQVLNRLTNNHVNDTMPAWAPAEDKIAFVRAESDTWPIYVKDISSGSVTQMTDPPSGVRDLNPRWSPNGNKLVFSRDFGDHVDVVTVNVQTGPFGPGAEHTLLGHAGVYNSYPNWSPGGGKVVFARNSDAEHDTDIFILDVSSGNVTRVTNNNGVNDSMPAYSPDGKKLVWARGDIDGQVTDDLAVRSLSSGTTTALTSGSGRLDEEPDWGVQP